MDIYICYMVFLSYELFSCQFSLVLKSKMCVLEFCVMFSTFEELRKCKKVWRAFCLHLFRKRIKNVYRVVSQNKIRLVGTLLQQSFCINFLLACWKGCTFCVVWFWWDAGDLFPWNCLPAQFQSPSYTSYFVGSGFSLEVAACSKNLVFVVLSSVPLINQFHYSSVYTGFLFFFFIIF